MNCDEWFDRLYQILDRDLDESVWKDLEAHMKLCQSCWDRFEFEKRLKARLKESCCKESCTEKFRVRIKALFEKY
jgi:mycothiol system anti-sigma-R factor